MGNVLVEAAALIVGIGGSLTVVGSAAGVIAMSLDSDL